MEVDSDHQRIITCWHRCSNEVSWRSCYNGSTDLSFADNFVSSEISAVFDILFIFQAWIVQSICLIETFMDLCCNFEWKGEPTTTTSNWRFLCAFVSHSIPHLVMVFMVIGSGVNILHAVWMLIGHSLTHSLKCVCAFWAIKFAIRFANVLAFLSWWFLSFAFIELIKTMSNFSPCSNLVLSSSYPAPYVTTRARIAGWTRNSRGDLLPLSSM